MLSQNLSNNRITIIICSICWIVFLLTSNRSLVAGYTLSLIFLYLTCIRFNARKFHLIYCLIILAAIILILSVFIDSDSTKGRLLIYKISTSILQDHFLSGIGHNKFETIYNTYQAEYFRSGINTSSELLLADNTYYAFNDYFQFIIEYGIAGAIILTAYFYFIIKLIIHLLKHNKEDLKSVIFFSSQIVAISFAAFFTHLFEQPIVCCILISSILLLMLISIHAEIYRKYALPLVLSINILLVIVYSLNYALNHQAFKDWEEAKQLSEIGEKKASIKYYKKAYNCFHQNYNFLVSYGNTLQALHQFESAILVFEKARGIQISNSLLDNLATCYQSLGNFKQAEILYLKSIFTVPNRFTNRYHLFNFYLSTQQTEKAFLCGSSILSLPVKIQSDKINNIRNDVFIQLEKVIKDKAKTIFANLQNI